MFVSNTWLIVDAMKPSLFNRVLRASSARLISTTSIRMERRSRIGGNEHTQRHFSASSSSTPTEIRSLGEAFEIIARSRYAERHFAPNPVSAPLIKKILELSILAPSSFNLQPYKMLVVQDENARLNLSTTMLGGNSHIVSTAPTSIVFLADKEPHKATEDLIDLEIRHGTNPKYAHSLRSKITLLVGPGWLASKFKKLGTHLRSPLTPSPKISDSPEVWSIKNTALASQQLMLAAAALGVQSSPMEGFDERRVCFELNIPMERYSVPLIVSLGYSKGTDFTHHSEPSIPEVDLSKFRAKVRFPVESMCYQDAFGSPLALK